VAIRCQDRHPVALAQAQRGEAAREPRATIRELPVGEARLTVDDGYLAGSDEQRVAQRIGEGIHERPTPARRPGISRTAGPLSQSGARAVNAARRYQATVAVTG
jgi:hypothetical protein